MNGRLTKRDFFLSFIANKFLFINNCKLLPQSRILLIKLLFPFWLFLKDALCSFPTKKWPEENWKIFNIGNDVSGILLFCENIKKIYFCCKWTVDRKWKWPKTYQVWLMNVCFKYFFFVAFSIHGVSSYP